MPPLNRVTLDERSPQPRNTVRTPLHSTATTVIVSLLALATALSAAPIPVAKLAGKWSTKSTSPEGKPITQVIEISGDELKYQALDEDRLLLIYAKGKIQTEAAGPINLLKVSDIQGGQSATSLEPVGDDRTTVFILSENTLTLASNFDKERDNQPPRVDVYRLIEAAKPDPAAELIAKLTGKWKVSVTFNETESDYGLEISSTDGKLGATLISPRSGEHKASVVTLTDGKLTVEVQREIQGNQVTLVYTGELKGEALTGTAVAKGAEDQYKATWKAKK